MEREKERKRERERKEERERERVNAPMCVFRRARRKLTDKTVKPEETKLILMGQVSVELETPDRVVIALRSSAIIYEPISHTHTEAPISRGY